MTLARAILTWYFCPTGQSEAGRNLSVLSSTQCQVPVTRGSMLKPEVALSKS